MKKLILNFLVALVLIPSLALAVGKTYESSTNQTSQTIAGEKNDGSNDIVNFPSHDRMARFRSLHELF